MLYLLAAGMMTLAGGLMWWNECRKWEPDWIVQVSGSVMVLCGVLAGVLQVVQLAGGN